MALLGAARARSTVAPAVSTQDSLEEAIGLPAWQWAASSSSTRPAARRPRRRPRRGRLRPLGSTRSRWRPEDRLGSGRLPCMARSSVASRPLHQCDFRGRSGLTGPERIFGDGRPGRPRPRGVRRARPARRSSGAAPWPRDAQALGGLLEREAGEVPELDELGLDRVFRRRAW